MSQPTGLMLKYYWNGIVMLLGVLGYTLVAYIALYPNSPDVLPDWAGRVLIVLLMPLLMCFAFGISAGVVIASVQLVYGVIKYVMHKPTDVAVLHHCGAALLWLLGAGLFCIAVLNGLILTV